MLWCKRLTAYYVLGVGGVLPSVVALEPLTADPLPCSGFHYCCYDAPSSGQRRSCITDLLLLAWSSSLPLPVSLVSDLLHSWNQFSHLLRFK